MTQDAARHPTLLEEVIRKREELAAAAAQELAELEPTAVAAGVITIPPPKPTRQPNSSITMEPARLVTAAV